jgi:hypothetical protein
MFELLFLLPGPFEREKSPPVPENVRVEAHSVRWARKKRQREIWDLMERHSHPSKTGMDATLKKRSDGEVGMRDMAGDPCLQDLPPAHTFPCIGMTLSRKWETVYLVRSVHAKRSKSGRLGLGRTYWPLAQWPYYGSDRSKQISFF